MPSVEATRAGAWVAAKVVLRRRRRMLAVVALATLVLAGAVYAAGRYMATDERLGVLRFPISCGWSVERDFTTATALLHLFQFDDAEGLYRDIAAREPDCAIAYWGIAMSRLGNPLYADPTPADVAVARDALRRAALAQTATPRERAYLSAVETLFDAPEGTDWGHREAAYAEAMEKLAASYPEDREAQIFLALALNVRGRTSLARTSDRARAAELLLLAFAEEPKHPGIDHYLVYCLGHAAYQPKPFERGTTISPGQRMALTGFALVALLGLGAFVLYTSDLRPGAATETPIGGPFALTAHDGSLVTDRSFRGKWLLVYFGYTHCPEVCPATLASLAAVLQRLGALATELQPVFVTIDPERDDPARLRGFLRQFGPRFIGLTGTSAEIAAMAKQYRVYLKKVAMQGSTGYLMEPSSCIYVLDPKGQYVTLLRADQLRDAEETASRLRDLVTAGVADRGVVRPAA